MGGRRSRLVAGLRIAIALLVVGAVGAALVRNWDLVRAELARMPPATIGGSLVLALLAPVLTLLGWRVLLADLGTRLPVPPSASVFFLGQLGKYLPGSLWSIVAQAEMGRRLGVPRRRMGVVGLLAIGLGVVTGALVGIPAIPFLIERDVGGQLSVWWTAPAVLATVVLLSPRLLNWSIATAMRVLRREPLETPLSGRAIVVSSWWFVLAWLAAGLSVLVLAHALVPSGTPVGRLVLASVSGYVLAAVIGMFSVFVPAGVGVRDGILALLLTPFMPLAAATAVVVVSRFLTILADVAVALAGYLWGRSHHLLGGRHEP